MLMGFRDEPMSSGVFLYLCVNGPQADRYRAPPPPCWAHSDPMALFLKRKGRGNAHLKTNPSIESEGLDSRRAEFLDFADKGIGALWGCRYHPALAHRYDMVAPLPAR